MAAPGAGPLRRTTGASGGSATGNVTVVNTQAQAVPVSVSNFPATQPVSGSVAVSNFPATQPVSGAVSVSNFPSTQPVSGTIAATQSGTWTLSVSNFPATQQVSDAGGSLTIDTPQLPATLGAKTSALSASVVLATDQASLPTVERGSSSMNTGQVQVNNTTAVQVVAARPNRRSVTLAPSSQFTYFVGNSGVTATTGLAVLSGGSVTLLTTAAVFVIAQSTGPMTFMEVF
jgi:hypothetical protein